jgi:hypothetical protein
MIDDVGSEGSSNSRESLLKNLLIAQCRRPLRIQMQRHVMAVDHDGVCANIDAKDLAQHSQGKQRETRS